MLNKLLLYGGPGVGKSVFAFQWPKPFFICTDGNYEFLKIFGAKDENHVLVRNWGEIKKVFQDIYSTDKYDKYQTIVVDLLEDTWKWFEYEWLEKNKIEHPSDMGWGKAYDVPRNKYFIEIGKLLGAPKNILLLCHEQIITKKTKKGTEYAVYTPSSKLPDKLLDSIEGRLTGCLRCYTEIAVTDDGKQVKKRLLNLVPQDDEFGIIRGINEDDVPHTIELKYKTYAKIMEEQQLKSAQEFLDMLESDEDVIELKKEDVKKIDYNETHTEKELTVSEGISNEEKVTKRKRKVKSEGIQKEIPDISEFSDIQIISNEKPEQVELPEVEKIEEKSNEQKKLDILEKIKKAQERDEEKSGSSEEVKVSSKQDVLNQLRKLRKEKDNSNEENLNEENPIQEEKKSISREEKLAKLRAMREGK